MLSTAPSRKSQSSAVSVGRRRAHGRAATRALGPAALVDQEDEHGLLRGQLLHQGQKLTQPAGALVIVQVDLRPPGQAGLLERQAARLAHVNRSGIWRGRRQLRLRAASSTTTAESPACGTAWRIAWANSRTIGRPGGICASHKAASWGSVVARMKVVDMENARGTSRPGRGSADRRQLLPSNPKGYRVQMASPSPKPVDLVDWKGWNSRGRISGAIPGPLSGPPIQSLPARCGWRRGSTGRPPGFPPHGSR